MSNGRGNIVEKAREYYNSSDADTFYFEVWGGEDIHIGLYKDAHESIFDASRRTVTTMANIVELDAEMHVLDIGAGYGGSARYLAANYGTRVKALNLSEVENARCREMNRDQDLDALIDVIDGNFETLPFDDDTFDVVWSQDAILHSGEREKVFEEVNRVLKSGGTFIFTDPMQQQDADPVALQPVYARIHLDNLGSIEAYNAYANTLGWKKRRFEDHSHQLPRHYQRVHDVLEDRYNELQTFITREYLDRMKTGLQHWINAGNQGLLRWGILIYDKP